MTLEIRRKLIALVTFIGGLYFFLEFLLPEKIGELKFGAYHEQILRGVTVVGGMAIGLGLINILRVHGSRLVYAQKGWINSFSLLLGMGLMFYFQGGEFLAAQRGIASWKPLADLAPYVTKLDAEYGEAPAPAADGMLLVLRELNTRGEGFVELAEQLAANGDKKAKAAGDTLHLELNLSKEKAELLRGMYAQRAQSGDRSEASTNAIHEATLSFTAQLKRVLAPARELANMQVDGLPIRKWSRLMYEGFFVPLGTAMFALLAFYIANAAYRSFRVKSVEASVMMLTAVVVILGQTPFGLLYVSENLPAIRLWLLQNVNTPGNRAIYFGAAVGGFAMAVRMWLSLEKNPLESDEGAST